MANSLLILESVAFTLDYLKYAEAERKYYEYQSGGSKQLGKPAEAVKEKEKESSSLSSLSQQIAKAREQIQTSLQKSKSSGLTSGGASTEDSEAMREENILLKKQVEDLQNQVRQLSDRVAKLEVVVNVKSPAAPVKASGDNKTEKKDAPEDDDDVDLFASDEEEDEEAAKIKEQRLAEYAAKKSKKPALVAKSNVILDVKPWDDETDMVELEKVVRSIEMEGLLWGVSKLVPVGYGIRKLQINTVIVDDLVSVDELTEKLEGFEDYVQSVDIAAFNKI